jgi:hypothetical protein
MPFTAARAASAVLYAIAVLTTQCAGFPSPDEPEDPPDPEELDVLDEPLLWLELLDEDGDEEEDEDEVADEVGVAAGSLGSESARKNVVTGCSDLSLVSIMFCVQAQAWRSMIFEGSAPAQTFQLLSEANAESNSWVVSCRELRTCTSFSLAFWLAAAIDCDADEIDAAEPPEEEELEHAVVTASTAATDTAPAAPRENRRDIRMPAVLPCRVQVFKPLKFSALYTADFRGEEAYRGWSTTL